MMSELSIDELKRIFNYFLNYMELTEEHDVEDAAADFIKVFKFGEEIYKNYFVEFMENGNFECEECVYNDMSCGEISCFEGFLVTKGIVNQEVKE